MNYQQIVDELKILQDLSEFEPLWVGTIPINIHIEESDVDIICFYSSKLETILRNSYSHLSGFSLKKSNDILVCNFIFKDVPFEIYAEKRDPKKQNGYQHMIIEEYLLKKHGETFRQEILRLKRQGIKTEPAFAMVLGLEGDPYIELLKIIPK